MHSKRLMALFIFTASLLFAFLPVSGEMRITAYAAEENAETEEESSETSATEKNTSLNGVSSSPLENVGKPYPGRAVSTQKIKDVGSGVVTVLKTLSILGMVIAVFGAAIQLMMNGYRAKNAALSELANKMMIFIIIFSASALINLITTLSKAL